MSFDPHSLLDRFEGERFAFELRGWKEPLGLFWAASPERAEILAERQAWLRQNPERHRVYLPSAQDLVDETCLLAGALDPTYRPPQNVSLDDKLLALGGHWEADFILCRQSQGGRMRMEAAVVCFPSHWAPETRLGLEVEEIHAPVPGLNGALAPKINNLLERLPASQAWLRVNWGLSSCPDRNQHPLRHRPRLGQETPMEQIWLRVEHQALVRLPQTQGILFGIRLHCFGLESLQARPAVARAIAGQLRSMPAEMQAYKGIQDVAGRVAGWLEQAS